MLYNNNNNKRKLIISNQLNNLSKLNKKRLIPNKDKLDNTYNNAA